MKHNRLKIAVTALVLMIAVMAIKKSPAVPTSEMAKMVAQTKSVLPTSLALSVSSSPRGSTQAPVANENKLPISTFAKAIAEEAEHLYVPSEDPAATDRRLERMAQNLNATSAAALVQKALDSRGSANERFLAVYLLGERAMEFRRELQLIALQPMSEPHDTNDINVRIQAMVSLESVPNQAKLFEEIQKRQTDALLVKLAKLGAKGSKQGQPFIQKYVDLQMSEILSAGE